MTRVRGMAVKARRDPRRILLNSTTLLSRTGGVEQRRWSDRSVGTESPGQSRRNPPDRPSGGGRAPAQPGDQIGQLQQVRRAERRPTSGNPHKRVLGDRVGPGRRQAGQLAGLVEEVDPVVTPVLPTLDELELLPEPRMETVRHSHQARMLRNACIRCSRRPRRTTARNATSA